MSRKTKKEKMASALRRIKKQTEISQSRIEREEKEPRQETVVPKYTVHLKSVSTAKQVDSDSRYSYVISDIKKVGLLMILAIAFEIVLNLTLRTNFAKLLLRNLGIEI